MDEKLKTHSGDTLPYDYYQQLLKLAAQNHDQSNRYNLSRCTRNLHDHDLISGLTETSNSSEESFDIDSPDPVLMANTMSRRGNNNNFNANGSKHSSFDKDHVIPKED